MTLVIIDTNPFACKKLITIEVRIIKAGKVIKRNIFLLINKKNIKTENIEPIIPPLL
jgi:hypothetical protein